MAIDASIPLRVKAANISVPDYDAEQSKALQLKSLLMQQQQQERGLADEQAQRQAFQQSGGDSSAYLKALASSGNVKAYGTEQARQAELGQKNAQTDQAKATTNKTNLAAAKEKLGVIGQVMSGVRDQASYDAARQELTSMGIDVSNTPPQYSPIILASNRAKAVEVEKQIDQALRQEQLKESQRHNKASEGLTARGQNMTDARSRENTAATVGKPFEVTGPDGMPMLVTQDKQGNIKPVQGYSPKAGAGGATGGKVNDAKDVLALLDQAEPLVKKATSSYSGAGVDEAARVFGASTPGANAAAQLRALEGALISKMPKMSGPQSDKDVLLYKQMAGQIGDRTVPTEQKLAAMQTIREINERHAGVSQSTPSAKTKAGASVSNW
jgi:hypothetical protein